MTTYKMWIIGHLQDLDEFHLSNYTIDFIFKIL